MFNGVELQPICYICDECGEETTVPRINQFTGESFCSDCVLDAGDPISRVKRRVFQTDPAPDGTVQFKDITPDLQYLIALAELAQRLDDVLAAEFGVPDEDGAWDAVDCAWMRLRYLMYGSIEEGEANDASL